MMGPPQSESQITPEMIERATRGIWMARGYERDQFDRLHESTKQGLLRQAEFALREAFGVSARTGEVE